MAFSAYSTSKAIMAGALGGVVASLIQGLFGYAATSNTGKEIFFVTIARKFGMGDSSIAGGWGLHIFTGLVAGAVFVGVTSRVKMLSLSNFRRGIGIGVLAGIAIWSVLFVPVTAIFLPEDLGRMTIMAGGFVLHMLFGTIVAIISVALLRQRVQGTVQK